MSDNPEITERLVRIETKIDVMLPRQQDHEDRLRVIERHIWTACGIAVVLSVFAQQVIQHFVK